MIRSAALLIFSAFYFQAAGQNLSCTLIQGSLVQPLVRISSALYQAELADGSSAVVTTKLTTPASAGYGLEDLDVQILLSKGATALANGAISLYPSQSVTVGTPEFIVTCKRLE